LSNDREPLSFEERRRLARLATPLSLVFWGALLVVLDLRFGVAVGGRVSGVDVLPDTLGYVLMAAGFCLLAFGKHFEGKEDLVAAAVATLYIGLAALSLGSWFFPALDLDPLGVFFLQAAASAGLVATCWILYGFCRRLGLAGNARAWAVAGLLVVCLWPLPSAIVMALPPFRVSWLFLAFAVLCGLAPLVAFLSATFRLGSAARRASPPQSEHRGVV
jgi:hypothetical protein